jgi:signal transduction histidine kinase
LSADCIEKQRFNDVLQLLDRVLEQARCTVQGLRSPTERFGSVSESFAKVPNELGLPSTVGFRVAVRGEERELRAELLDEFYSIGREAIVNAYRHSRATDIEVEVEFRPTELWLAVRDNGCGIDPQNLRWGREGHWGLQGMRERADRIGARLRLWTRVGLGTEVELSVPGRVAFKQSIGLGRRVNWSALAQVGREYGKEGVA